MSLKDLGGVFSRYFLAGFFVPALSTFVVGVLLAAPGSVPPLKDNPAVLSRLTVLTAIGLLVGLILLGLRRPIIRVFEGYPLEHATRRVRSDPARRIPSGLRMSWWGYQLWSVLRWRQERAYERMSRDLSPAGKRNLDRSFAGGDAELLPTRLGNVLRAFEYHANSRWRLGGLAAWPRIAGLLSDRERDLHADVETDVMFFLNCCVGSLVMVTVIAADRWGDESGITGLWPCGVSVGTAYGFYRLAVVAAVSWGTEIRSSIDLHRLELYERLGVRRPRSFSDERDIAESVTRLIEFGEWLPDQYWGPASWKK
ncbi:MAG: hypothetical protein QOG94_448 [Solirubrobacteraceae bacterium]|nr:hypothetical protein [Solirubrobacteraceae bacterium]